MPPVDTSGLDLLGERWVIIFLAVRFETVCARRKRWLYGIRSLLPHVAGCRLLGILGLTVVLAAISDLREKLSNR